MSKAIFTIYIILACTIISALAMIPPLCASEFSVLDRNTVMESSEAVTRERYPNAEVVHVAQRSWIKYNTDGTYVQWYEAYVKILSEKGRRRYTSVTSSFTIPYNTTMFKTVEVIRSDGSSLEVDIAKNSREMIEQSQMESNIYNPNDKLLRVTIPEVNIGDMVHFVMFDDFTKARMPGTWSDYVTFEGTDPIVRSEYIVVAPKDTPLKSIALKAEIPGTISSSLQGMDDEIIYTWTAKNVPRAYEEPQMPKLYTQAQRLLVSTIPDWETVSRWYWELSEPHIKRTTPQMEKTVENIVRGIDDPTAKIVAIFRWVSQGVRYLGITAEKDAPGYEPHPVDMTFERRSGVCRDKAALLVSMLRLAGFDAFPVLIMNGPKKDPEVPQPFFNHAVSCVRKKDGTYLLMDPTDESTKELFPAYLNNQSYLVATPEGETLLTSPIDPAEWNMMHIETTGSLDKQGNLKAVSKLRFDGINDNAYRGFFSRLSPEERRQYFERIIKRIAPGAVLTAHDISPENMLDTSQGLKATLNFEVKDYSILGNDSIMLPLIRMGGSIGMVNFLTRETGLTRRKYPYVTDVACGVSETFSINLGNAAGKPLSLPVFDEVNNEGATWKRTVSVQDDILISKNTFSLKLPEYSPQEYLVLKQTLLNIEADSKKMPLFSSVTVSTEHGLQPWYAPYKPDAVILEEVDEFDVENSSTWTETKRMKMKVLTYAGKKRFSDLHVRYNPAWEEVEITSAVVTTPDGGKVVIEDKEMNLMDDLWVADASRYPASKVLVVSLPGVEEGSIIEYTIRRKKTGRLFFSINGEFCSLDMERTLNERGSSRNVITVNGVFRAPEPIEKKTLRITVPKRMHLNVSDIDERQGAYPTLGVAQLEKEEYVRDGKSVHEYTATEVPPVIEEDFMPPWHSFNPVVFASSVDWERYAKDVRKIFLKATSSKELTEARARAIIAGIDDEETKILKIRDYVAKNIKYIDVAFGDMPLSSTSSADRTLIDGYGNSADRAVVLYAMLESAGFKPEFVLASRIMNTERLVGPLYNYPFHQWFSDLLVRIEYRDTYVYLNDTDQYAALGSTKNYNHPGLVLKSGEFEIIQNASEDLDDRTDAIISIELSAQGDVMMKTTRRYYGGEFASFHKRFREMPPEERVRHHQKLVSSISQAAQPKGFYITDYESYPGTEEFSVTAQGYATRQGNYLYLDLPGLIRALDGVSGETRKNPLYLSQNKKRSITLDVALPAGIKTVQFLPPENETQPVRHSGKISLNTRLEYIGESSRPVKLIIRQDMDLDPAVIMPEEYPQIVETHRVLSHPRSHMILLELE